MNINIKNIKKEVLRSLNRYISIFAIGFFAALMTISIISKNWHDAVYQGIITSLFILNYLNDKIIEQAQDLNDEMVGYVKELSQKYVDLVKNITLGNSN